MPRIAGERTLPHPVDTVFDVAMDLERYPSILPYIKSVDVVTRSDRSVGAFITLGLSMLTFSYRCDIAYERNELIAVTSAEPIFTHFAARCRFGAAGERTTIGYELDCTFRSPVIEALAGLLLPHGTRLTIRAFEDDLRRRRRWATTLARTPR